MVKGESQPCERQTDIPLIVQGSTGAFSGAGSCKASSALMIISVILFEAGVVQDLGSSIGSTKFMCRGSKFWD